MGATTYKSIDVDRLSIFYREAGSPDAPTLLLLHGFPSSSRMYEPLFTRLADVVHLVAPDYPGFGHSDAPDPTGFDYTFDKLAQIIERFTEPSLVSTGTASFCRITEDPSGSAWRWHIPIDLLPW